jgi:hypothetical protein
VTKGRGLTLEERVNLIFLTRRYTFVILRSV